MARRKRQSVILEMARQRLAGLKQITPKPNFGAPLTEEAYAAEINAFIAAQDSYNGDLAALDDTTNQLDAREQLLADLSQRILAAVRAHYGPDSNEVEQVGGVRRSDRKKPVRTPKTIAA